MQRKVKIIGSCCEIWISGWSVYDSCNILTSFEKPSDRDTIQAEKVDWLTVP